MMKDAGKGVHFAMGGNIYLQFLHASDKTTSYIILPILSHLFALTSAVH